MFIASTRTDYVIPDRHAEALKPEDFEMVAAGPRIPVTYNCVRNP